MIITSKADLQQEVGQTPTLLPASRSRAAAPLGGGMFLRSHGRCYRPPLRRKNRPNPTPSRARRGVRPLWVADTLQTNNSPGVRHPASWYLRMLGVWILCGDHWARLCPKPPEIMDLPCICLGKTWSDRIRHAHLDSCLSFLSSRWRLAFASGD